MVRSTCRSARRPATQQTEAISLAFVTALQVLPARQRAVLILREVLGYHANEVAEMLDSTVESVNSALKRARAGLQRRLPPRGERETPPAPDSPAEQALVANFVRAYESGDVDSLVALLTADVCLSMPPIPLEYEGRDAVGPLLRHHHAPSTQQPRADAGKWSAGVRDIPSRPNRRRAPRDRPARPHPHERRDLRHDPLRQQRAPMVRAAAIAPCLIIHCSRIADVFRTESHVSPTFRFGCPIFLYRVSDIHFHPIRLQDLSR